MLYGGRHSRLTAWDDKHVVVRRLMFIRTSLRVWPMWQVVSAFSSAAGRQRCRPPSAEPRMVMREGGPRVPIEPVGDKKTIDPTPALQWHFTQDSTFSLLFSVSPPFYCREARHAFDLRFHLLFHIIRSLPRILIPTRTCKELWGFRTSTTMISANQQL